MSKHDVYAELMFPVLCFFSACRLDLDWFGRLFSRHWSIFFPKKIIIEDYDKAINKGFNKFQKCNMISLVWILIQKWKSENINAIVILNKWKWKKLTWRGMWPTMVTHILNLCSAINPSKVHTHSSEHTHTYREHTPGEVDSHLCCGARGAVRGSVPCSWAPQSWYWGWRECCTFTPPTYNSCRTWDSNSQPLGHDFPLNG